MYDDRQLGKRLRDIRLSKNLSQQTLAENLKMTRASVSNIESGKQALSLKLFVELCYKLDQDPGLFLVDFLQYRIGTLHEVTERDVENPIIRNTINKLLLEQEGDEV